PAVWKNRRILVEDDATAEFCQRGIRMPQRLEGTCFFLRQTADLIKRQFGNSRSLLQQLRDLHGIQRGTFEQLIARYPKSETVLKRAITPHPPDLAIVLARNIDRHGITIARL